MNEKPKKPRRPKAEVAADYVRRAARIHWAGVRDAVESLGEALTLLNEAQDACGDKGDELQTGFVAARTAVSQLLEAASRLIPTEVRS